MNNDQTSQHDKIVRLLQQQANEFPQPLAVGISLIKDIEEHLLGNPSNPILGGMKRESALEKYIEQIEKTYIQPYLLS